MHEYQATEAKAHLAEILTFVAQGNRVAITRHGKRIAHVVPVDDEVAKTRKTKVAQFKKQQQGWARLGFSGPEITDLRHEGHRY